MRSSPAPPPRPSLIGARACPKLWLGQLCPITPLPSQTPSFLCPLPKSPFLLQAASSLGLSQPHLYGVAFLLLAEVSTLPSH